MPSDPSKYLCGIDGRTYKSTCELRATSCNKGRTIRMAYIGSCQSKAYTCVARYTAAVWFRSSIYKQPKFSHTLNIGSFNQKLFFLTIFFCVFFFFDVSV